MGKTVYCQCPICENMLEVRTEDGSVVRSFKKKKLKPGEEDSLTAAVKDLHDGEKKRDQQFEKAKEEEKKKKERLASLFDEKAKEAKKTPPEKPQIRPFDLD